MRHNKTHPDATALPLMRLAILAAVIAAIPLLSQAAGPSAPASPDGYRPVPLAPAAGEALQRLGKEFREPFPNADNWGTKFNPYGSTVPPLITNPELKILVICIDFPAPPPGGPVDRLPLTYFDDLLFGTVYDPPEYAPYPGHATNKTLRNYWNEVSYGAVSVVTDNLPSTIGWMRAANPYEFYCRADGIHDNGRGSYPDNVQGLVIEAVLAADPFVDFSKYAVNGEVTNLFIVHAGTAAEFTGDPSVIWSHYWRISSGTPFPNGLTVDGVKVNYYGMMGEVGGDMTGYLQGLMGGPFPPTMGTYAHEFGHILGLRDLYDYGYESDGVGMYSLMAGGSWAPAVPGGEAFPGMLMFLGSSPVHLDAWSKYRLGFVTPIKVEPGEAVSVSLPPVETNPVIYRMDVPNSDGKEYFLLENRQHIGFDESLNTLLLRTAPGTVTRGGRGLAIWHIDETVFSRAYRINEAENWKKFRFEGNKRAWTGETHYAISLIQADNQWDLEKMVHAGADAGDLYPGPLGITRFGSDTFPNSTSYYFWPGSGPKFGYSGVTVDNITETDDVITADLYYDR
jgi:immune inhibitor A